MKPHFSPSTRQIAVNSALRKLPFYAQTAAAHLSDTKHGKAYSDYGYPLSLDFWFYYSMYRRIGLARAAVKRPIDMCWLTAPKIMKSEDQEDVKFKSFAERLKLWPKLRQIDDMQSVGHYAGAILRIADGKTLDQPLDSFRLDDIKSIMPAWEGQLIAGALEQNQESDRYGLPIEYTYQQSGVKRDSQRDGMETFTVHHSRVLIWNEGAVGNTIYGESCLEPIYNALMDWEKVRGAGAEGFWKKAALRAVLQDKESNQQAPDDELIEELTEALTDMQNSFDQVPHLGGMELKPLGNDAGAISGIEKASQIALEDVAAGRGWSAKGLVGAQTGRLAGEQDSGIDKQTAQSRRVNYLNMQIGELISWLDTYCSDFDGKGLVVEWDDLMAPSDRDRLELSEKLVKIITESETKLGYSAINPEEIARIAGFEPVIDAVEDDEPEEEEERD